MVGHQLVPTLTGSSTVPVCGSEQAIDGFLRGDLGFDGVVISDALDMGALDQGPAQVVEIIAMMCSGTDLLLCMPDIDLTERVRLAVERGHSRGLIPDQVLRASVARIEKLRGSLSLAKSRPEIVGSEDHQRLAVDLARRSVTLVRNHAGLLPLSPDGTGSILCLEPEPVNVTPADTTALYPAQMGEAIRAYRPDATCMVYPHDPGHDEIEAAVEAAREHDLVIVGTVNALPSQSQLVEALLATGKPVIAVALRTPHDLAVYPAVMTFVCTYSSHRPSLQALASALFGGAAFAGNLPAAIPGLYPRGHGIQT
jgi:beta-N-acetylhexosaminidase